MKRRLKSMALGMAILLAAVTGVAATVSVDYDHETDFKKYKTFAIAFAEGQTNLEASSPLVHQTILENIKKHLVLRGLTEVVSGNIKKTRKEASRDIDKMFEKWARQHEKDLEEAERAKN